MFGKKQAVLKWEDLWSEDANDPDSGETNPTISDDTYRAKVHGGWIVAFVESGGTKCVSSVFVPDPDHAWNYTPR